MFTFKNIYPFVYSETWSYDTRSTHFFRHSFTATSPNLLHDTRNLLFDQPRGRSETRKMDINSRNLALPNNIPTRCMNYSPIRAPSHSSQVDRTGSFHWVPDIPLTRATLVSVRLYNTRFTVYSVG